MYSCSYLLPKALFKIMGVGVFIMNITLHGRLEIGNFSSRVEKYSTCSLRLPREIFFNTQRETLYPQVAM